jgi:small subunit ribosomal protein S9
MPVKVYPQLFCENQSTFLSGKKKLVTAKGTHKKAVAFISMTEVDPKSSGMRGIWVNGRHYLHYFQYNPVLLETVSFVLKVTKLYEKREVRTLARGGGLTGQARAIRMGLARAVVKKKPLSKPYLRYLGFITRDARIKERKKYGLKKARKAPQWHKR